MNIQTVVPKLSENEKEAYIMHSKMKVSSYIDFTYRQQIGKYYMVVGFSNHPTHLVKYEYSDARPFEANGEYSGLKYNKMIQSGNFNHIRSKNEKLVQEPVGAE